MKQGIATLTILILGTLALLPTRTIAFQTLTPNQGDFLINDFRFESGETLPLLKIHYRTLGKPVSDSSGIVRNAVLILHGTGGAGTQFLSQVFAGGLFGPGQPLDIEQCYIILPDGIGHGDSSKPSNGLRMKFPHYNYNDMVTAQYRLLTEKLKVNHLRLVMGTSMGGMHTWVWAEKYPDFMDAAMPLASLPVQIAGRNRMIRRMVMDSIRNDPEWKGGDYESQPVRGLTGAIYALSIMSGSPLLSQKQAPTRDQADKFLDNYVKTQVASRDANNLLYQFDASRDYDPSPLLETIKAPLFAVNSADDQVNPPELGILEREIKRVKKGRAVVLPISERTQGHGSHSVPSLWKEYLESLLQSSKVQSEQQSRGR
jgi:homoserine O-acetyltransferase/O-succinyltransferase